MRIPKTWFDISLLEDEPFLSAFKARQLAAPPTRRCAGRAGEDDDDDDARNRAIVDEIMKMDLVSLSIPSTFYKQLHIPQLKTVQAWLNLAFIPHYRKNTWRQVDVKEPGMICLFVKFYWTLSHSYDDATGILHAALKEQGFGLDEGDTLEFTAGLTKQVHPKQSQIGDDFFQSLSKEVPGSIPRDIEFQKNLNAKTDVPDCSERQGKALQTCLPSLDPTSLPVTCQIELNSSSTLPLPPDSRNTTAICNLPKKRKERQISPDRRRIKHRKVNKATSDTSKLCNVSQIRNDVIDEKTKARPTQREDISDKADHGALCDPPPLKKVPGRIPQGLKFNKICSAKKDVPDCPEGEGKSSLQNCPPSLDPIPLSVTRKIEFNPSTFPLPPDSQNTTNLPKPRKRQTSPDTPRKKYRGINEATSDASKLGDNNNFEPHSRVYFFKRKEGRSSTIDCRSRIELDKSVLSLPSNAPEPEIRDPWRGVEVHSAQGRRKSCSNLRATKKTSVLAPPPKDATRQPKQYKTTSKPSNLEGHQRKRQEVPVDQVDSVPVIVEPDLVKKKRGRAQKVKEEQEGSASVAVQPAPGKKRGGRPPKVKEGQEGSISLTVQPTPRKKKERPFKSQAQLNAGIVVPFSGQNVDMAPETSITSFIPLSPAQSSLAVSVEGFSRHDHVPWSTSDGGMKEGINHSVNWLWTQEHVLFEEGFILDCEDPAAIQMEDHPTNIFPTHKPPLCINPPIWAQVCDNALMI